MCAADQHKMCLELLQSLNYALFSPGTCKISRNKSGENSLRRGSGTLISNSWIGKKYAREKGNPTLVPGSFNVKVIKKPENMVISYFTKVSSVSDTSYIIDASNSEF